jgi:hypothetical protein
VDSDSNVTDESLLQKLKHDFSRISTEAGIKIDLSDEHSRKAPSSIR